MNESKQDTTGTIPGYWMRERSGVLRPVVERYLRGETLAGGQVGIMRAYIRQWMAGDFRGPEAERLRRAVDSIVDHETLTSWLRDAAAEGIDPL